MILTEKIYKKRKQQEQHNNNNKAKILQCVYNRVGNLQKVYIC